MMRVTPAASRIFATATPAAPSPTISTWRSSSRRPVILTALSSAASTTTAVPCWSSWKTGMSSDARRRSSISKQRGAEMSSRLMPPKPGAIASTVATIASGSLVLEADRERVDAGELLEEHALALHHRHRGLGADVAEAEHGRAVRDDRDRVALDRVLEGLVAVVVDRHADARDARRVGHREVVAGLERVLVVLLDLAADVHPQRAVGGVDHRRAVDASTAATICAAVLVAGGVDGDVAQRVAALERDEVDGADRAAGVADRARDLAEHAGAVVDLDAERQGVLGRGRAGHVGADLR